MSINYAILGLLSIQPLTGYDLKKIMQESSFMYWSGNNNQIYKALLELHHQGYVTNEIKHQSHSPSKKIYTITNDGLLELRRWLLMPPQMPEYKKPFLIQLAWSEILSSNEILALLDHYEKEIQLQIVTEVAKHKKGNYAPNRTDRETFIWNMIYENIVSSYKCELDWISQMREKIVSFPSEEKDRDSYEVENKEENNLTYQLIEKNNKKYILLDAVGKLIEKESDSLDLISLCAQNDTNNLMIRGERLSNDFLRLSTGLAGSIAQKFVNYGIRAAIVLDESHMEGKFKQFASESNLGNILRIYTDFKDAEQWLTS